MSIIRAYHLDGINIDYEGNAFSSSSEWHGLTIFTRLLRKELRKIDANSILSICWVFCPFCIMGRTYDLHKIKHYVDYFVVMMYDMQWCSGNYNGYCRTCSQDAIDNIQRYAKQWTKVKGLSRDKVIIALGWYGFLQSCEHYFETTNECYTSCSNINKGWLQVSES